MQYLIKDKLFYRLHFHPVPSCNANTGEYLLRVADDKQQRHWPSSYQRPLTFFLQFLDQFPGVATGKLSNHPIATLSRGHCHLNQWSISERWHMTTAYPA